jgi:hypothetical protein
MITRNYPTVLNAENALQYLQQLNTSALDFYVGSTDESGDIVRERDARIRILIKERKNSHAHKNSCE